MRSCHISDFFKGSLGAHPESSDVFANNVRVTFVPAEEEIPHFTGKV